MTYDCASLGHGHCSPQLRTSGVKKPTESNASEISKLCPIINHIGDIVLDPPGLSLRSNLRLQLENAFGV